MDDYTIFTKELLGLEDIEDREWSITACSAKSGEGLTEGMEWIVSKVRV